MSTQGLPSIRRRNPLTYPSTKGAHLIRTYTAVDENEPAFDSVDFTVGVVSLTRTAHNLPAMSFRTCSTRP